VLQGIQRAVTSSEYDHVGIVVRIPQHSRNEFSLFILEATSDGVQKYALRSRLRAWHLSNAIVALRQLKMKRTFDNMSALSKFVETVDGKPYGLGPLKLLRRHSKGEKENYFCSELVASAFKTLDILPDDVPSNSYLPASFGDAGNLHLTNHASLEKEIIVDFEKPAVVTATVRPAAHSEAKTGSVSHSRRTEEDAAPTGSVSVSESAQQWETPREFHFSPRAQTIAGDTRSADSEGDKHHDREHKHHDHKHKSSSRVGSDDMAIEESPSPSPNHSSPLTDAVAQARRVSGASDSSGGSAHTSTSSETTPMTPVSATSTPP